MMWSLQFYNERRGLLARYGVEAALPAEAVVLARRALIAEYPADPTAARRTSLYHQAQTGSHDSGWVLYRIAGVPHSG